MRGSTTGSVVYFAPFDQRKDSIALNEFRKMIGKFNARYPNSINSQKQSQASLYGLIIKFNHNQARTNWIFVNQYEQQKFNRLIKLTKLTKLKERDKERHTMWLGSSPDCASSTRLSEYVSPQITKRVIWEFIDQKLDEQTVHSLQLKSIIL